MGRVYSYPKIIGKIIFGTAMTLAACSSQKEKEDASIESSDSTSLSDSGESLDDEATEQIAPEESLSEESLDSDNQAVAASGDENASSLDESLDSTESQSTDTATVASTTSPELESLDTEKKMDDPSVSSSNLISYKKSQLPNIQWTPFKKGDHIMNGVHFVRGYSKWSDLSTFLYGRADRDVLLKEWNTGISLKPGTVVYYNSPTHPDDTSKMRTVAQDFDIPYENHKIKKGESLSSIAKALYGNHNIWREIAAINTNITDPDRVSLGQNIQLLPVNLNTQEKLTKLIAEVQNSTNQEVLNNVTEEVDQVDESKNVENQPVAAATIQPSTPKVVNEAPKAVSAEINESPFTAIKEVEPFKIAAAIGIAFAFLGLIIARRSRKVSPKNTYSGPFNPDTTAKASNDR